MITRERHEEQTEQDRQASRGFGTQDTTGNPKIIGYRDPTVEVFAWYRNVGGSCPATCPFIPSENPETGLEESPCYGAHGNCRMHSDRAGRVSMDLLAWYVETLTPAALARLQVTGDCFLPSGEVDWPYLRDVALATEARPDVTTWTYFHGWRSPGLIDWYRALPGNIEVVASCETAADVRDAFTAGWATAAITAQGTAPRQYDGHARIKGRYDRGGHWDRATAKAARAQWGPIAKAYGKAFITCPAQRIDKPEIGCADCRACMKPGYLVGFAFHSGGQASAGRRVDALRAVPEQRGEA